MPYMTKTAAARIARHLHGQVHRVAASGNQVTWGYTYACAPRQMTTANCGTYAQAVAYRSQSIANMVDLLTIGRDNPNALPDAPRIPAPEWMTEFQW